MPAVPVFLSLVYVVRNRADQIEALLQGAVGAIAASVSDYELIVIDNASEDHTVSILKTMTGASGLANLQVYALTTQVDIDTAYAVGLEHALGDVVAIIDPLADDIAALPAMLAKMAAGADVVFGVNRRSPPIGVIYRAAHILFNLLYKMANGIRLPREMPQYRLLSRRVVNYILQHPQPAVSYRHLPATAGFARDQVEYDYQPPTRRDRSFGESAERGLRLLVSTTSAPMRLVTGLSMFGAAANLLYSVYVLAVAALKTQVAPGWVSLSLQQSGMFFLISLVLLVLSEYILHTANLAGGRPQYHIAQEFTSIRMTRRERLNIEEAESAATTRFSEASRHGI
ncbi:glycosyltransferase [Chitinimonas sp.]|uniref:glycosyltransferase n=1 Tax=Chitinimonas sp. TaxID=1934313 RepID=UPI0035B20B05